MQVIIRMEEIYGKDPRVVAKILRLRGIDTSLPYRARISSLGMTIEQIDRKNPLAALPPALPESL